MNSPKSAERSEARLAPVVSVMLHTGTTLQNGGALNSISGSNWSQNTPSSYRSTYGMGRNGASDAGQQAWLADPQMQNSYGYARKFKDRLSRIQTLESKRQFLLDLLDSMKTMVKCF